MRSPALLLALALGAPVGRAAASPPVALTLRETWPEAGRCLPVPRTQRCELVTRADAQDIQRALLRRLHPGATRREPHLHPALDLAMKEITVDAIGAFTVAALPRRGRAPAALALTAPDPRDPAVTYRAVVERRGARWAVTRIERTGPR